MSERLSVEGRESCTYLAVEGPMFDVGAVERVLTARLASRDARLAAVEALLALWDGWDGTRPHPGESSPRQRDQLRAALHPDPSEAGA